MATGSGTGTPAVIPVATGNYIEGTDVDNWVGGATAAEKQDIVDRAEHMIEQVTRNIFYEKDTVLTLDGNGKDRLFTGIKHDLLSITSITSFGTTIPATTYTFDKRSVYIDPSLLVDDPVLAVDYWHLFPKGKNNIVITCTTGSESCPSAIKQAAIILCRAENDSTLYSRYSMLESESFEGHSVKRHKFMTGILEADRLLSSWIKRVPVFAAV